VAETYEAELLGGPVCELGEGPTWDAERQELTWVDILGRAVHRAWLDRDGRLGEVRSTELPAHVGSAIPAAGGGWILGMGPGLAHLAEDGTVERLVDLAPTDGTVRMNDAKCDAAGRWWGGSMAYDESRRVGSLYRVDLDGSAHEILTGVGVSNGLGWTADGRTMFFNDSGIETFSVFDFDAATGTPTNRRILTDGSDGFIPDGLTVDDHDTAWSVWWDHGTVRRYDPAGTLLGTVSVPVPRTSSCCFAGPDRDLLVITTGHTGEPDSGRLFVARPGVTGPAAARFTGRFPRENS
jgi:sugar lactone lactonase YvrE